MRSELALAALASAAVPGMKPVTVAGMSSADPEDDTEVQRALVTDATGRSWVVHAPLTPVAGARMRRNDELVRQLARHVPFKVPTPVGYAALGTDGDAAVYPHVEGSPLDLGRLPPGQGLASALGRAIASVHNIPRGVFEDQDVPVFDATGCRQRATSEVDRASETGRVPTGLLARWEEAFDAPALWQFATTPVHGGFSGRTVLVAFGDETDASTGRVVAVTDWGEAMVGDPATDLAALYASASPQAWEAVLDSYALARAQRPDPYLHARARLIAETRALRGLASAVAEGREQHVRKIVEALRRMDRLTEEEDSLVPVTARPRTEAPAPSQGGGPDGADDRGAETALHVPVHLTAPHEDGVPTDDLEPGEPGPAREEGADSGEDTTSVDVPHAEAEPDADAGRSEHDADPSVAVPGSEDPTVEVPRITPAPGRPDEPGADEPEPGEPEADEPEADDALVAGPDTAGELEDLDDEQRLHELYGMPDGELEPGPDDASEGSGPPVR